MKDTTLLKFLYIFELTAPVFYRVNSRFISDPEEKKLFIHFAESEDPHSPMIKDFLRKNFNTGVFPLPFIIQFGTVLVSLIISLFGKRAIYFFEWHFETKATNSYTTLQEIASTDEVKKFAKQLYDEELVHLNYFKERLGYS